MFQRVVGVRCFTELNSLGCFNGLGDLFVSLETILFHWNIVVQGRIQDFSIGVHMYLCVGSSICQFCLIFLKYPMKMI